MSIYQPKLKYYIYAYIRSKDSVNGKAGTPYYIGKGTGARAWKKGHHIKPKDNKYIIVMESNLTNVGALALEMRYIRWYGRVDIGTGILHNKTFGGEQGFTDKPHTNTTKEKIRNHRLENPINTSYMQTEEYKNTLRKPKRPGHGAKVADSQSHLWYIKFPDGHEELVKNFNKFCRDHDLAAGNLYKTVTGEIHHSKHYSARKYHGQT